MFAYWLVSGHWCVQTGVARTGEEGTVTTVGVLGLNVITGSQQRKAEWVDVAWFAMRVHVGRRRKGGVHVIDVQGEEDTLFTPLARKQKAHPPARGDTDAPPPPQKDPRTATPGGAGGAGGKAGAQGAVGEWVEQQHQLQRAGAWKVRTMSTEAANRHLQARLSRANDDRRPEETRLAEISREGGRLVTRVKTLERSLGTARKAAGAPAKPPAHTPGGPRVPRSPRWTGGGGGNAVGVRYLLAGVQG